MRNSKLVELLSVLDAREWDRLRDYVYSPYFNKREEVCQLFDFFYEWKDQDTKAELDKKQISEYVFPDGSFDEKQLAYLFNYLLRLAEDFLVQEDLGEDEFILQRSKLSVLLERRLKKHFSFQLNKSKQRIEEEEVRSDHFWRDKYWLSEIEAQAFMSERKRQYDQSFQNLSDALDDFYFYEKLRYSCAMVNLEAIGSTKYDIQLINELIQNLGARPEVDFHIDIYLKIYECLTEQDNEKTFTLLRRQVELHQNKLSTGESREIILFLVNICLRKIRQGYDEYYVQALDLYEFGIKNRILFDGSYFTHWTYNNVVKLALRVKRHKWLDQFIDENAVHLAPNVREQAINFSKAELAFSEENFDGCLEHINKVNFTDPQYYLGSRIMLLKSFYAIDAFDSMSSQLASFMMFLRRNKKISNDYKQTLLNFCSLLHLILRSRPDKKEKVVQKINDTKQKIEGEWLLKVADEML